jgi:hypothetical protein
VVHVAQRHPAGEHTRPHLTVGRDRDNSLGTVAAELGLRRYQFTHAPADLPEPIGMYVRDAQTGQFDSGLLNTLAVTYIDDTHPYWN